MSNSSPPPGVSVVMSVYNGRAYLAGAIESILGQSWTDFEFIIIDDGSTDGSGSILEAYAAGDERLVLRRNPTNLGLIKSLNRGLALAQGQYIARQDADDISLPERLAAQVAYLDQHPRVGLLGTGYYRQEVGQSGRTRRQPPLTDTGIRWGLLFGNVFCHPSVMFRRALLDQEAAYREEYPHVEDYELWTRLLARTRAANLNRPLVIYRVHPDSICSTQHRQQAPLITALSDRQLSTLLPGLARQDMEALRRCYNVTRLAQPDMDRCRVLMWALLAAFAHRPGIDPGQVRAIRRHWLKRLLTVPAVGYWRDLWLSGLLGSILKHDAGAAITALLVYLPRRIIRSLWRRGQA